MILTQSDIYRAAVKRLSGAADDEFDTEESGGAIKLTAWRSTQQQPTEQEIAAEMSHPQASSRVLAVAKESAKRELRAIADNSARSSRATEDGLRDVVQAISAADRAIAGLLTPAERGTWVRTVARLRKWSQVGAAQEDAETQIDLAKDLLEVDQALEQGKTAVKGAGEARS